MARPKVIKTELAQRLIEARHPVERSELAKLTGVSDRTIGNYERGESRPDTQFLHKLTDVMQINLNWLITGKGSKKINGDDLSEPNVKHQGGKSRQAPITGLASCGPDGWSRLESTQFRAELPISIQDDKGAFAVISRGESMQPFGIYEGYLCFCSPATELLIGDIVCIERIEENGDISLTIKKLGMIGHGAVEIIGYLPLKETVTSGVHSKQSQELFWETVHNDDIERISVVTHIHTRPSAY